MAAGRYGGYRSAESRERDSSYDIPRRERGFSKDGDDQTRNGVRVSDRDFSDRGREKGRSRQKDVKEREPVNGNYRPPSRSDSGASGGGPRRCEHSVKTVDREPGELSSESGSDGAAESKSKAKDAVAPKMENGTRPSPVTRKRKFSPIVWDRDDTDAKRASKHATAVSATSVPSPQPLPKADDQSPKAVPYPEDSLQASPVACREGIPMSKVSKEHQPVGNALSEVPENVQDQPSYVQRQGDVAEAEQQEEEDYFTTRHISSSRWAGDADSPADEGEISDDGGMSRGGKMQASKSLDSRLSKRSSSPEFVDANKKSDDRAKARSDEGDAHSRPSSGDRSSENTLVGDGAMELDGENNDNDGSPSQSDTVSEDGAHSRDTSESPVPPQRTVNMLRGCRSVDEFERLNKIDEGTYGVVYRAKDKKTGEVVALKKVKMEKEREGFPLTSLREINILLSFHHSSIVDVKEVVVGSSLDSIFMVMEYMEHDLKALMESMKQPFSQSEVKCLMLQLLEGIKYLHDNWVLHRDLKTSNLLLNNRGELKICDFGLARQYGSPLKPYTRLVVTLWYRAPELLLGAKQYSTAIDMWSLGCIMAELLSKEPLFNGRTEFDQLDKIFKILGTPNEAIWPGFSKLPGVKVNFVKHQYNQLRKKFPATSFTGSPVLSDAGFDLLNRLLTYDPEKRITAEEALQHGWFREVPLPKSKEFMPTFPAQHAQDRRMRRVFKSPDPLEEQRKRELHQAEFGTGGLFG